jgi:hypothetical protein
MRGAVLGRHMPEGSGRMPGHAFEDTRELPRGARAESAQGHESGQTPGRDALPRPAPAAAARGDRWGSLETLQFAAILLALLLVVVAGVDRYLNREAGDAPARAAKGDRGAPLLAEESLRDRRESLDGENLRLRDEVQALSRRLAELERQIGSPTGSLHRSADPAGEPAPPAAARDIEEGAAGSVPGPVVAGRRGDASLPRFGLHLASFSDLASARQTWSFLKSHHGALFQDLSPVLAEGRDPLGNLVLRLQVGPFHTAAAAEAKCAELKIRQLFCALSQNFNDTPGSTL